MRLKTMLATLACAVISAGAAAQDKIYLQNGGIINAKVKEVSPRTITYKKWDNQDGPDFIIRNREVTSITYANGTKDMITDQDDDDRRNPRDQRDHRRFTASRQKYPRNILAAAPIQMANEGPAGFGLQYERVVDKNYMFSVRVPFAAIFYNDSRYNNGYTDRNTRAFCYFYPGIKIYPTGNNRRVSYGVGPSVALGFGKKSVYNNATGGYRDQSVFKSGLLLNNSLNIQPTKNLYIGLELGLGFSYYNNEDGYNNSFDTDEPMVQFNFAIGYRF